MAALRLGVLGGTFDPPHYGHLLLAEQAREQLGLERVLWVPAGDPWRKAGTVVSTDEHRVAMVSEAIEDNEAFEVDTREIERAGPSYTVDTLASLKEEFPTGELVFLLGADALADLPHWHDAPQVIRLALLGATARGGGSEQGVAELEALLPQLSKRVVWFQMPRLDISATGLRERAAEGRSLRYFVPPAVEAYIGRNNLYSPA
jgi:nicotinate-nucleotide adenylyltransferase